MKTFTTTKILYGDKSVILYVAEKIRMAFVSEGYYAVHELQRINPLATLDSVN